MLHAFILFTAAHMLQVGSRATALHFQPSGHVLIIPNLPPPALLQLSLNISPNNFLTTSVGLE